MTNIHIPTFEEFLSDCASYFAKLPITERLEALKLLMTEDGWDEEEYENCRQSERFAEFAEEAHRQGKAQALLGSPCTPYDDAAFVRLTAGLGYAERTLCADIYCRAWQATHEANPSSSEVGSQDAIYNHVFSLAFEVTGSASSDGSDISGDQLKKCLQKRLNDLPSDEMLEACGMPDDTDAITFRLVSDDHGYRDFDIENASTLRRACVPHDIKLGDQFNVYYAESSKCSCLWKGDLASSLLELGFDRP